MPNWCSNQLILTGISQEIFDFNNANLDIEKDLDFNNKVPFPEDRDFDKEWHMWRIINWGTKWTAADTIITFNWEDLEQTIVKSLIYEFNTAWSPPSKWLLTVSELYPNIEFEHKYCEPNCDFSGITIIQNGNLILDENGICGEYYGDKLDDDDELSMSDY